MNRRNFLKSTLAALTILPVLRSAASGRDVPRRTLGRTDEKVSILGIGGFHLGGPNVTEAESIRIVQMGIDGGINFLDNSWDYHGGISEIRMGKALRDGYREKVFLMTKLDGRNARTAAQQLDDSLRRLQTDRIDLIQFHEIIRNSDPQLIFAPGGAIEAMLKARQAGKVRYIGFTGHKSPEIHLEMLRTAFAHGFTFDTVQMPLNVMDAHFDSFEAKVLPVLVAHNIGVIGMKSMGDHFILNSKVVSPVECLHYAMNLPTSVVVTGCDSVPILVQALQAASSFQPMTKEQVAALLARTAQSARGGQYELYKTSHHFDGTYANPQWLG
jgi:uncharacterized protein